MAQCDPKRFLIGVDISGNSKVTGDLEVTGNILGQEFRLDFNANTDWVAQTSTPIETYKLSITHNLTTNTPDIEIFEESGASTIMCPTIESNERISFTQPDRGRFAGYIYVRK